MPATFSSPQSSDALAAAVQLTSRWAELIGVVALYPDTNRRVQDALSAYRKSLEILAGGMPLPFVFAGEALRVGSAHVVVQHGTKVAWLKERFDHAALAGIRLSEEVDDASLVAFSRRLLEIFARRGRFGSFLEIWPERWDGLDFLERRFDGSFGEAPRPEAHMPQRGWIESPKTLEIDLDESLFAPVLPSEKQESEEEDTFTLELEPGELTTKKEEAESLFALGEELEQDDELTEAFLNVRDQIDAGPTEDCASGSEVLEWIAKWMPSDVAKDAERALAVTRSTLEQLAGGVSQDHRGLLELAEDVGQGFFANFRPEMVREVSEAVGEESGVPSPAPDKERKPDKETRRESRPEDSGMSEEEFQLAEALEELGDATVSMTAEEVDAVAEQLAVFLHMLGTLEQPEEAPALERGLLQLLEAPDAVRLDVLWQFLQDLDPARQAGRERLLEVLRAKGRTHLLQRCGALNAVWVVREYPHEFLQFVEGLDLSSDAGTEELTEICERIGLERIEAGMGALEADPRLAESAFARTVLRSKNPVLQVFVPLLLGRDSAISKTDTIGMLLEGVGGAFDRELVALVRRPDWLSSDYLLLAVRGEEGRRLDYQRQATLTRFLRATQDEAGELDNRIRAVELLGGFPTVAVLRALERIVQERRLLRYREPARLRSAAQAVLRSFPTGMEDGSDV